MYLTKKQLDILDFIWNWRETNRVSPTLEEMARHFGVTKITIYEHLNQLEKKGAIRRSKFRARSIEVLTPPPRRQKPDSIPLVGSIRAGAPLQTESARGTLRLNDVFPLENNCYALKVQGDSMGERILDGDYVVVEDRDTAEDGETIVAVLENGEATLKKYYRDGNRVRLQPERGDLEPIYTDSVEIRGVVVGLLRRF